jgi:excisionase family DNA binding protein
MNTHTTSDTEQLSATNPVLLPTTRTMTAKEVCRVLTISRANLYRQWDAGRGPRRIQVGRHYRVTPSAMREYLLKSEVAA